MTPVAPIGKRTSEAGTCRENHGQTNLTKENGRG